MKITQGDREVDAEDWEVRLVCSITPEVWTLTWTLDERDDELVAGPAVIEVQVSTNPGEFSDETDERNTERDGIVTIVS